MEMKKIGIEVLYDDRTERACVKFTDIDLIGIPWQISIGPRNANNNLVEFAHRSNSKNKDELSIESVLARVC